MTTWLTSRNRTHLLIVFVVLTSILALNSSFLYLNSKSVFESEFSEYLWMKSAENAIRVDDDAKPTNGNVSKASLIDYVTSAALANNIEIDQYRSDADGAINITIYSADFAEFMNFMNAISQDTAVGIQAVSLQASSTPGVVSATLKVI